MKGISSIKLESSFPMDEKIRLWEKDNHIASAGSYYVHMGVVNYYIGQYEEAELYLQKVKDYLRGLTDNVLKRQWHVFLALNALRLHEIGVKYKSKQELLSYINPLIKKIETWVSLGPLLKPYLVFFYAELERVIGDLRTARNLYFDAVHVAHEYHYTFLEGYLNESLGEFIERTFDSFCAICQSYTKTKTHCDRLTGSFNNSDKKEQRSPDDQAGVFFKEAVRLYRKCHAGRKEILLIEKYPEYFGEKVSVLLSDVPEPAFTLPNIDMDYLKKFSLVIPAEIGEDALLHKIMNVVLESSGAQHGYLVVQENADLIIRVESHITEKEVIRTTNQKFEDYKNICHAIVRYVYRTKEVVLLDNASEVGKFKDNPEVQEMKLRSVLCLPVIKKNRLIGILYLENRLADSIFTAERAEVTKLLTYQAAISWDNARLVEKMKQTEETLQRHRNHLEEMVEERTRQLRKTRENLFIAERLAVLGKLSGSISHEIRNPLNVISSSAYFLKLKLGSNNKKIVEHIERIEAEVKNSVTAIDSLLSLSGIKEPQKKVLDIGEVLAEAIDTYAIPDTIDIGKDIPKDKILVKVDKAQMCMVFHNIIKNAIEAMNNEGDISLRIRKKKKEHVEIHFIDTGIGIPHENMDKIFQPLYTTKQRGAGFGLAICKMIIDKHEGWIAVQSEPDKGTVVMVTLPLFLIKREV